MAMSFDEPLTDIQQFYQNANVFLTGATGFVGKLWLEKILRCLPVNKVYLLVRSKKGVDPEKRFQQVLQSQAFEPLKRINRNFHEKIFLISGDCSLPGLGLSTSDREMLIKEINVIFHCAATVRFDQKISSATFINVRGTKDILEIAKEIKNLKTLVHVSTAYSNSPRVDIMEKVYPPAMEPEKLISLCETLDDDMLEFMTPKLIGDYPNTYTYTKQIAEELVNRAGKTLPCCIVRPSIILSTAKEPLTGFIDTIFTLAGFALARGLGILQVMYSIDVTFDYIPVDYVVNCCIAAGWKVGGSYNSSKGSEVPIFNIVSSTDNPITNYQVQDICIASSDETATEHVVMHPLYLRTSNYYVYVVLNFIFHTMTSFFVDSLMTFTGRKPFMADIYKKVKKSSEVFEYFVSREFYFTNNNTKAILKRMSNRDRELFFFDMQNLDWESYLLNFVKGLRVYLLKDPMETLAAGKKHCRKLKVYFFIGSGILIMLMYFCLKFVFFKVMPMIFALV